MCELDALKKLQGFAVQTLTKVWRSIEQAEDASYAWEMSTWVWVDTAQKNTHVQCMPGFYLLITQT